MTWPVNSGDSLFDRLSQPAWAAWRTPSEEFDGHVGGHLVGSGFSDAVDHIGDVFASGPVTNVDDEAGPLGNHNLGGVRAAHEGGAEAGVDHAGPAVSGLLPEGEGPSVDAVFIEHAFVAGPSGVDEEIESGGGVFDLGEGSGGLGVNGVVAGDAGDGGREVGGGDGATGGEDLIAGGVEGDGDAFADAATGAGDEGGFGEGGHGRSMEKEKGTCQVRK